MQQLVQDVVLVDLRRRGLEAVDDAAFGINSNMRFHSKEPFIAPLCRRYLDVARLALVLGRGRV